MIYSCCFHYAVSVFWEKVLIFMKYQDTVQKPETVSVYLFLALHNFIIIY